MDSSHFDKEPEEIKVAQFDEEDEETKEQSIIKIFPEITHSLEEEDGHTEYVICLRFKSDGFDCGKCEIKDRFRSIRDTFYINRNNILNKGALNELPSFPYKF